MSGLNFSEFSIEQYQLTELQNMNSNYIVGVRIQQSLPHCCRQTSTAAARGFTELASPHCSWCKSVSAYSKHTGVLMQCEEKRGEESGKKPGGSYKLTAIQLWLKPPSRCTWLDTEAGRACTMGKERSAGLGPLAPWALQPLRADWDRKEALKCPGDKVAEGKTESFPSLGHK